MIFCKGGGMCPPSGPCGSAHVCLPCLIHPWVNSYQSGWKGYKTLGKNNFWTMTYPMTGLSFNLEVDITRILCFLLEVEVKMRNLNYDPLYRAWQDRNWRTHHILYTIMTLIHCKIEDNDTYPLQDWSYDAFSEGNGAYSTSLLIQ